MAQAAKKTAPSAQPKAGAPAQPRVGAASQPRVGAVAQPKVGVAQPKVGALIRARRRQLHMTLQALCSDAGISVGYLSQVERDHATPSLGTLAQIARSLDVGVDYFISTPSTEDGLTRADDRTRFAVDGSSIVYERIAADFAGNVLSSFVLHVPPGYRSETVSHEGEEILFVLEGAVTQRLDNREMVLGVGDSLHFRGNQPHSWSNETKKTARLLWVGTLPMFRSRAERTALRTSGARDTSNKVMEKKEKLP